MVFFGCFPSADDVEIAEENIGYLFNDGIPGENVTLGLRADAMISPIVLVMLPLVYIVGSMAFGISNATISIALNLGFSWMPMVNCFTTAFFVKPYRIAVEQLLCGRCCTISSKWSNEVTVTSFIKVKPKVAFTSAANSVKTQNLTLKRSMTC
uniref:Uncharacterized protein n=1 Tax=Acrobeloides nanus TaxID=290746 RepID=A0A914E8D7_9BILA